MLRTDLPEIITETLPGPKAQAIIDRRAQAVPNAIRCGYPVVIERGEGAMIEDVDGNKFLDWIGGVGVLNIGFSQPEVVEAVKAQADKYFHGMFNVVTHEGYVALAEKLSGIAPVKGDSKKAFFANSGAEADENAVKVAKAYTKRPNIIVFSGAFHGRTHFTMAMTSKKAYAKDMGPLAAGVFRAQFPYYYRNPEGMPEDKAVDYYIKSIYDVFEQCAAADTIAAIVVEPLQGEGGFIPAPIEWVKAVRKICDENGILMICDEVQCGMGRTGNMFAWQGFGVKPDILTMAKAIGNGIPVGAFAMTEEVAKYSLQPGDHGATYGGNPLACTAVKTVIEIFEREDIVGHVNQVAPYLTKKLDELVDELDCVVKRKGKGLMQGLVLEGKPVGEVVTKAIENGLLVISAGTNVLRMVPPLVITEADIDEMIEKLEKALA